MVSVKLKAYLNKLSSWNFTVCTVMCVPRLVMSLNKGGY